MLEKKEKQFDAIIENLVCVNELIESCLTKIDCPIKVKMQIDIAVEEIFVNIVKYAYPTETGTVTVQIELSDEPLTVTIVFTDQGIPYNPLTREDPDVSLSAKDRQIGGLGIFITKKAVDEIFYEYKDRKNILTLKKVIE